MFNINYVFFISRDISIYLSIYLSIHLSITENMMFAFVWKLWISPPCSLEKWLEKPLVATCFQTNINGRGGN